MKRSLGIFSSGFRDSCFDKLPGISILNKFFEDCIIFFLHIRRANKICSPDEMKKEILFALHIRRANKICSPDEMKKENDTIFKELVQNGYPRKLVKTTIPEPTRENP